MSILRYPGGKSKVASLIVDQFPEMTSYWEPMVGGGAVFQEVRRRFPKIPCTIGDRYEHLVAFWRDLRDQPMKLINELFQISREYESVAARKQLFQEFKKEGPGRYLRGTWFFYLNRCSFSGTTEAGGFSASAAMERFTKSSISKLNAGALLLKGVDIQCTSVFDTLKMVPWGGMVYLDPPYVNADALYGFREELHHFDHQGLSDLVKTHHYPFILSYDESPAIRDIWKWADISTLSVPYGMGLTKRAEELIICRPNS